MRYRTQIISIIICPTFEGSVHSEQIFGLQLKRVLTSEESPSKYRESNHEKTKPGRAWLQSTIKTHGWYLTWQNQQWKLVHSPLRWETWQESHQIRHDEELTEITMSIAVPRDLPVNPAPRVEIPDFLIPFAFKRACSKALSPRYP